MRFCEEHWDKLRAAIEAEGLSHLIAKDGSHAARNFADALERDKDTLANFDPLMTAHWAIISRIADVDPRVLFAEGCPLCFAQDEHEAHCVDVDCKVTRETFEAWIPSVAAAMVDRWEQLKAEAT